MAIQNNNILTWTNLTDTFYNSMVSACCNIGGYSQDVPTKLRDGLRRTQVHATLVGDNRDRLNVFWYADTANLITTVDITVVANEWNSFLTAAGIKSRSNKTVAAGDFGLAMADFMQFLSYHVKPICSIRQIYQEIETPYLYRANQYVTGTTPTPTYVFGGTDRPDQQNLTDNVVRNIVNKGFNVTQLMQKYNGTNPKIPRCYLS